jgi:hypothetical protein
MAFGVFDHQVNIDRQSGDAPDRFDDERTHGNIRHKLAIHHIDMDPIDARLFSSLDLPG